MTREEEIAQAADEDFEIEAVDMRDDLDFYKVYRAGVIYGENHPISPWISVEDDLPCNHDELIYCHNNNRTVNVLVCYKGNVYAIEYMFNSTKRGLGGEWRNSTPCYWMPIPKLPKE